MRLRARRWCFICANTPWDVCVCFDGKVLQMVTTIENGVVVATNSAVGLRLSRARRATPGAAVSSRRLAASRDGILASLSDLLCQLHLAVVLPMNLDFSDCRHAVQRFTRSQSVL